MCKLILAPGLLVLASALAFGQSDISEVHHHNFAVGIGPAIPTGNSGTYLETAPLVAVRYGYRLNRYLQADAGFQLAWGAAHNQNAVVTRCRQRPRR